MDGYAVCASSVSAASESNPVDLPIIEDVRAGFSPQSEIGPGQASRISTGGLVPQGADSVVMREDVQVLEDGTVRFRSAIDKGSNIRYAGEHIRSGEEVLTRGTVMGAPQMGMAAFLGAETIRCYAPVTVAVLATGSELVPVGEKLQRGQIRDSNSVALASALRGLGCEVTLVDRVEDTPEALDSALSEAFAKSRIVITSGGISAGWHDLVRERIEKRGGEFFFHKLRMRPGKPLAFGRWEDKNFFCLPGNPVSSLVTFEIFVKPALLKLMGCDYRTKTVKAVLEETIAKRKGFAIYYRGIMTECESGMRTVRLTGPQGSHILRSMTEANVLIQAPEEREVLAQGSLVDVIPYNLV